MTLTPELKHGVENLGVGVRPEWHEDNPMPCY
jgi:hypothetical protein